MTPKGKKRLLKLAEILDVADARHRKKMEPTYDQYAIAHECGTPACALGHWAAANLRRFTLNSWQVRLLATDEFTLADVSKTEFSITPEQAIELFDTDGCGFASTAKQAARYIRKFVRRVELEQEAVIAAHRLRVENNEIDLTKAA